MIKKYVIFLSLLGVIFGQISMSDINKLSNDQLDLIKQELQGETVSKSYTDVELVESIVPVVNIESTMPLGDDEYFGYNYFKRDINFFDNIPTPPDFKLGPGDEIILSLWGETNTRENFVINKEGLIFYENIGFINLSNKTLKQAESVLVKELSRIYSTLEDKDNPTQLMLELGKLKSINVYFSGQIENPGINLIHPFSDIFSAIVQTGGVKNDGSLRSVQLIRKGKVVSTIDFYSFFTDGKDNFSSTKILDGDVIHIPTVANRVEVTGEVYSTGFFELINDESITDLITYAGGFKANASSIALLYNVIPMEERTSDDNARTSKTISVEDFSNINLYNGDSIAITSIGDVQTTVEILGRVKFPGEYPSTSNLKTVLNAAGGFNDPLYRKSIRDNDILVLRKDENQFYGLEFQMSYDESDKFQLIAGDKIFVYEDYKYNNTFKITIGGEVKKKGSFPLQGAMTVGQAINLAEGFTPLANPNAIFITQEFTETDGEDIITSSKIVNNVNLDFIINENAMITILPYEDMINVEGNVFNPGLIAYKKSLSIQDYIQLAGGYKENSLKNKVYIKKANGEINTIVRGRVKRANPGDTIVIPVDPEPSTFDPTAFTADIVSILTNLATIIFIIDSNSD